MFLAITEMRLKNFIRKNPTIQSNFIISYLYEAQHVSGDTPPIIRSLKLHWQPLVLHTWKVVGRVVGGRCQAHTVPEKVLQFLIPYDRTLRISVYTYMDV